MRMFAFCVLVTLCSCLPALAGDPALQSDFLTTRPVRDPWRIDWTRLDVTTPSIRPLVLSEALAQQPLNQQSQQPVHAAAVQHSDAYETRAKIQSTPATPRYRCLRANSRSGSLCSTRRARVERVFTQRLVRASSGCSELIR
jgi:hypothetical protein